MYVVVEWDVYDPKDVSEPFLLDTILHNRKEARRLKKLAADKITEVKIYKLVEVQ